MNENQRPHFWIPDKEVEQLSKELTARPKVRNVIFSEHGAKLSQGLQMVKEAIDASQDDDSLCDVGLYVFKVEFPQGEKVQHKSELFSKNGMHLNAVKDERHAIVSTTRQQLQMLKNRVGAYTANGANRTQFDYIESISPYIGTEKNSSELRKKIYINQPPETVDIQLMLIPNLQPQEYTNAISKIKEKIIVTQGIIQ